jgi:hypothetical protein
MTDTYSPPTTPFQRWVKRAEELGRSRHFEIGVPMRDGVELSADVYLPEESEQRPVPAIVTATPYGKDNILLVSDEARFYQANGYAFVAADVRGRGKSEGEWDGFVNDAKDTHDVIEWASSQPWCDGKIGTTGLSYMGWVQWAAASEHPEHLRAMVSTSAAGRWQQEIPYTNGIFQLYFAWWAYTTRRRINESYGLEHSDWGEILKTLPFKAIEQVIDADGPTWDHLCDHDTLDDFWRALRYDDQYDSIDVPCLHVTGWYDQEDLLGAFHHYEHMRDHSPAKDSQYLLVGPWSHVKSRTPDRFYSGIDFGEAAAHDMDAEHLRWFDHWLKGYDNGVAQVDRVRVFEPGPNRWRGADHWPLADTTKTFYLAPDRLVDESPADETRDEFTYDPLDPVPTGLDVRLYPFEDVPLDQSKNEARADVLSYTSEPVEDELTFSGWAALELYGASDCDDTDWHVKVTDVDRDGTSRRVTQGCLRAACRDSLEVMTPLTPGEIYRFNIELWPTHHVFLPGHRIRVTVTSSDFPWFARSMNQFGPTRDQGEPRTARNSVVHGGQFASRLVLPIEGSTD